MESIEQCAAYCWYLCQDSLLLLTPQRVVECHGDHPGVEGPHSLHSQLGDAGGVEQGVPALLHLLESESAGEVDAQVDGCEIIGLLHGTDQHEVVSWTPPPEVFDTCPSLREDNIKRTMKIDWEIEEQRQ